MYVRVYLCVCTGMHAFMHYFLIYHYSSYIEGLLKFLCIPRSLQT